MGSEDVGEGRERFGCLCVGSSSRLWVVPPSEVSISGKWEDFGDARVSCKFGVRGSLEDRRISQSKLRCAALPTDTARSLLAWVSGVGWPGECTLRLSTIREPGAEEAMLNTERRGSSEYLRR